MKVYLFPGQGSQLRGMGGTLFDEFPEQTRKADGILGYSIKQLCLEDPRRELNLTQFTQPAIYVVNALSYFRKLKDTAAEPDMLAGHSLGEFNALLAAGCFDFEQGLELVRRRGELLGRAADGGMAAIMNTSKAQVADILQQQQAAGIDIAIHNSPTQSVIAGLKEDLARVEPHFRAAGAMFYLLNTSGAFHSRYMQAAAGEFRSYIAKFEFLPPRRPVVANVSARPYGAENIVSNLVDQITHQVRWAESIQYLMSLGEVQFEEIGHGDVLTKLVKSINSQPPEPAQLPRPQLLAKPMAVRPAEPRSPAEAQRRSALEKVARWNATHPVGTRVRSLLIRGKELETRTGAVVLLGHRAAIYLQGYNGYFDLDQIETVEASRQAQR